MFDATHLPIYIKTLALGCPPLGDGKRTGRQRRVSQRSGRAGAPGVRIS